MGEGVRGGTRGLGGDSVKCLEVFAFFSITGFSPEKK